MQVIITPKHEADNTNYAEDAKNLPDCPKCGAKAYIHRDIADGFYFGWSVGCPRFCHYDGIHGTTPDTPEDELYSIFGLNSKEECIAKWTERVKKLKEKEK